MKYLLYFIFFIVSSVLISCTKDKDIGNNIGTVNDTTIHVSTLTFNDRAALLLPSLSKQLVVTIIPANAANRTVEWKSSDPSIVSVDANGLVTGLLEGTADIIATSADNALVRDTITVYVRKNYDVYVVGVNFPANYYAGGDAIFWKNGVASQLSGGYSASAITVSHNDVYIAGTTLNQWNWTVATYWKNGNPVQLSDPNNGYDNYATTVALADDTVYVAGWDFQQLGCPNCYYAAHAHYWKSFANTITDTLLFGGPSHSTYANNIALSNGNVYVAGTQQNDNYYSIAKYWVNGFDQSTEFTSGSWAQSNAISVNGNDVYVLGGDGCPDYGCINTPKLWKNNASSVISLNDGTKNATALCLGFSGNIAYAGGYEFNEQGIRVATCWIVNGNSVTTLPVTNGTNDAMIKALAIVGDDIFLAGYETDSLTGKKVATYWRVYEGAILPVALQLGYGQDTEANGIFAQ